MYQLKNFSFSLSFGNNSAQILSASFDWLRTISGGNSRGDSSLRVLMHRTARSPVQSKVEKNRAKSLQARIMILIPNPAETGKT